jgi:hypothetical protein
MKNYLIKTIRDGNPYHSKRHFDFIEATGKRREGILNYKIRQIFVIEFEFYCSDLKKSLFEQIVKIITLSSIANTAD